METNAADSGLSPVIRASAIWGALLVSQGMIVLVSQTAMTRTNHLSPPDQSVPASSLGSINPLVFGAVGLLAVAMAFFIPKLLLSTAKSRLASSPTELTLRDISAKVFPVLLIRWMLIEMITLVGFVASMLSGDTSMIYPYAAASLLGFVLTFPTEQKFRSSLTI